LAPVTYALFPPAPTGWGWEHDLLEGKRKELSHIFDTAPPRAVALQDRALTELRELLVVCEDDTELAFLTGAMAAYEAVHHIIDGVLNVSDVCDAAAFHNLVLLKMEQVIVVMLRLIDMPDVGELPPFGDE